MKSFKFKDLMVNVAPSAEKAVFCAATCHGTGCGFFTPCGYTCDYGNTHPTITRTVAVEQARVAAPAAFGCGFGGYTCNYGTYCGFSVEPCGYTCDYGNTHVTRPFAEQARAAAPAAQAGVVPEAVVCAHATVNPCGHITCGFTCGFHTCFGCTIWVTNICRVGPTFVTCQFATCGVTINPGPTIQVDPEGVSNQLAAVKAQLQQELAAIETQEKAMADALRPQTAEDVEELQGKLRDAIAELDKQKQELQKKSDKPSKK